MYSRDCKDNGKDDGKDDGKDGDEDDGKDDDEDLDSVEKMLKDQLEKKPNVHWDDIAGLTVAKGSLKETVVLPIKFPQLFTGKCE